MKITKTFLVFMAADNNLDQAAIKDLETIRKASPSSQLNTVVQLDRDQFINVRKGYRHTFERGKKEHEEILEEFNSGDPKILHAFIEASIQHYPQDQLIVTVWSHGSGIDDKNPFAPKGDEKLPTVKRNKLFEPKTGKSKRRQVGIAYDENSQDFLDNIKLQEALSVSKKIDIVGFDACLMGMFEIVYQLKEQTRFIVGSQYLEPSTGWPYEEILPSITPQESAETIAKKIVELYQSSYIGSKRQVTQSAYDCSYADDVAQKLDTFAQELNDQLTSKSELSAILDRTQKFQRSDYIDLIDFIHKVNEQVTLSSTETLLDALNKMIIANATVGKFMDNAYGVSIYFPFTRPADSETFEMYEKLDFSQEYPNWIELIRWYHKKEK